MKKNQSPQFQENYLNELKDYVKFIEDHHLELAMVLCDTLNDEDDLGCDKDFKISYSAIKSCCSSLDIIELGQKVPPVDDESGFNQSGYEELIQVLENFLWSNVEMNEGEKNY